MKFKNNTFFSYFRKHNINSWMIFFVLIYVVLVIKFITIQTIDNNILFGAYSILVSFYILSRFGLAYFYEPDDASFDKNYRPTISFAVPSKNEGENIRETIVRIAQTDYPKSKFDIIVINDGSTDNTLEEMLKAKEIAKKIGINVIVVDWKINKGKREGMAECIRRSKNDIIIFIDSDSFVDKDTAKELVKYFIDEEVAAVAGHAYVANANKNALTKMQAVRYYVAFKAYKSAEALFGTVTCCSGCCSAYRREYLIKILNPWLKQSFLGVRCTYGDDRSLTNFLLNKNYTTVYSHEAKAYTFVPDTFRGFMKQQLRWKKSWIRESMKAGQFMWKKNPIMSVSFYLGVILPLLAPIIVIRALIWYPYITSRLPLFYLFGLALMAVIYGLYYYIHTSDKKWIYGVFFATFYTLVLVWQLPWAILNLRDGSWGTR
ncbi:MAG: glycosyltransferase [Nanoarchaeota archaeon]